jgi:large subunit ribosomal protein L16
MAATQLLARQGRVYIRVFPHKPISSKPLETRMGKGKGEPDYYAAVIHEGTILYEIGGVSEDIARKAFARVSHKMPFRCRFVNRQHAL